MRKQVTWINQQTPPDPARAYPICIGGKRARPQEHCRGAWAYLQWREQYFCRYPLEDISLMTEAVRRFLESGDRPSIGGLIELRSAGGISRLVGSLISSISALYSILKFLLRLGDRAAAVVPA